MVTVDESAGRYLRSAAAGEVLGRELLAMVERWRDDHLIPAVAVFRAERVDTTGLAEVLADMLRAMADQLEQDMAAQRG